MKKLILAFSVILIMFPNLYADIFYDDNSFSFNKEFLNILPGARFFPFFFENYAPDVTYLIEENNAFSFLDIPKPYYEGNSPLFFNWYLNDFNINSALNTGSPAITPPIYSSESYILRGNTPMYLKQGLTFKINEEFDNKVSLNLSTVTPNMGDFISFAPQLLSPHAKDRADYLYKARRKIISNNFIDIGYNRKLKNAGLSVNLNYFKLNRRFNDFNDRDSTFKENGELFSLLGNYKSKRFEIMGAFNRKIRDNLFSEFGRLPEETYNKENSSIFLGAKYKWNSFEILSSLLYEKEDLKPVSHNFSKDLMDVDGEGLYPFEKFGDFSAITYNLFINKKLNFGNNKLKFFLNLDHSILSGNEDSFDYNAINFNTDPYYVVKWENNFTKYKNHNSSIKLGGILESEIFEEVHFFSKLFLNYSGLSFSEKANNVDFFSLGYDIGFIFLKDKNPSFSVFYGEIPYELRENINFFLEHDRPSGTYYYWDDYDMDYEYDTDEEEEVYGYTGSAFHSVDNDLALPSTRRFLANFSFKLSNRFRFNFRGIYKKFKNNLWVKFGEKYGEYKEINNQELYFYNQPFKEYILTNYDFEDEPFYGQLLMQLLGYKKNKWVFSLSFMAYMGMGYTSFGNGPVYNDIGNIDESMANPNSWINGFGRVDGDRAFVGKIFWGFYPLKRFSLGLSIKYRDGNPFAFFNHYAGEDNIIIYYKTIQAEDKRGKKGGPREDCIWDFSAKFMYKFKIKKTNINIFVSIFNFFDLGGEISEYVYSGGRRFANELQIPRSLRWGMSINF